MLFDAHVHIGQFRERYCSPAKVIAWIDKAGIDRFAYSSTTTLAENDWAVIREEYSEMDLLSRGRGRALLWVTPNMLNRSPDLSLYSRIPFSGIKIHGYAHPWAPFGKPIKRLFAIAREKGLPVKLHTGGHRRSEAGQYIRICRMFPDVQVILAHARPLEQAIKTLLTAENTWIDTAFLPCSDLKVIRECGLMDRVLFGSDLPIPIFFFSSPLSRYLQRRIKSIRRLAGDAWETISWSNPKRLFDTRHVAF